MKTVLTALAAAGTVAILIFAGSASGNRGPLVPRLSGHAAATQYLRSLGIRARGVVIQRGLRNYAGPHCPGARWNCTRGHRVLQIAAAPNASNVYECTGSPSSTDSCVIVQSSSKAQNSATCTQKDAASSQSCSITQVNGSGKNVATVTQVSTQSGQGDGPQSAVQSAAVTQRNVSGANSAAVSQQVSQSLSSASATLGQQQTNDQTYSILQTDPSGTATSCPSAAGPNTATASQSVSQTATGSSVGPASGSQLQISNLTGHSDQCSTGKSTSDNTQSESQNETVPSGSTVTQTQIGPFRCCSSQGTNPKDQFSISQSSSQNASEAAQEMEGTCVTSGTCDLAQSRNAQSQTFSGQTLDKHLSNPIATTLTLTPASATTADYHDGVTVAAEVATAAGTPLAGQSVVFALNDATADTCSATTNGSGVASCTLTPTSAAGSYTLSASYGGAPALDSSAASTPFSVTTEEATLAYTGPVVIANGRPATLSATLKEDGTTATSPSEGATFTLGSGLGAQTCSATTNASGVASCTIASVSQPLGEAGTVRVDFAGDGFYSGPSSDSEGTTVFQYVATGGAFVIGDGNAALGSAATFWSSQWPQSNSLSGGTAPSSFTGFAQTLSSSPPVCGGSWSTDTGNSTPPPQTVPSYMAVLVTSKITKRGSALTSTTTPEVVVVQTNPGYSPAPGGSGTGTVVAEVCPAQARR